MLACFKEELIAVKLEVSSAEETIRYLGCLLQDMGYVKETFCDAVIEREKVFATGLPIEPVGVAIPHTDAEHVKKLAIAVGVLDKPVRFGLMGGEGTIDVDVVFLMALDNCESQITMLQSLVELVQEDGLLLAIRNSRDASAVSKLLNQAMREEMTNNHTDDRGM